MFLAVYSFTVGYLMSECFPSSFHGYKLINDFIKIDKSQFIIFYILIPDSSQVQIWQTGKQSHWKGLNLINVELRKYSRRLPPPNKNKTEACARYDQKNGAGQGTYLASPLQ